VIVAAEGVSKAFGDLSVLRDLSLRVDRGERVALLGPSGCGKTTLLRILLGVETHDAGSVRSGLSRAGYLPQDALLLPWKPLVDNVALPLQIAGVSKERRRAAVRERLGRFGLAEFEDAYPHQLSGGMRQRAALLRAILAGADALVLDEPFGALDALTRHRLQRWLVELVTELARTLLFVTHDVDEAIVLSKRVVILSERPASVLGEQSIEISEKERATRYGSAFARSRDELMRVILEGEESAD